MNPDSAHRFLIAYDVADTHRRTRLAKTLSAHGDRVQYSVFLIDAKPARIVRLKLALRSMLDPGADSVLICDLGQLSTGGLRRITYLGQQRPITGVGPIVL
ncbi:CRISPR-associated endonuclease Cas2 [Lapillicoccus sp.]|uniref:CRISPR-associated endonuclease Cas2 n=1 Tax=Lapillicoccus sp. TaxID=1909287 RepID=UPI0025DEC52F|nr:CRISPR-associated endonuclease Cas2 [Lapillicoccus sp.]